MPDPDTYVEIKNLTVKYGNTTAVENFSSHLSSGNALAIAGANGAGKSSLLGAIAGLIPATGEVYLQKKLLPNTILDRLKTGIRLVPEHSKIYPTMTVSENLAVSDRIIGHVSIDDVFHWFPRLFERRKTIAGNLSGGEQQMLAIGMSILGSPKVLLLDEPSLGLSVPVIENLAEKLGELRAALNLCLIVAESDAKWLPAFTDNVIVLDRGQVIASFDEYTTDNIQRIEHFIVGLAAA